MSTCDGCGKVAPWDGDWSWWGSLAEEDEGIRRWTACSRHCMALMPEALRDLQTPHPLAMARAAVRAEYRDTVERLRGGSGTEPGRGA